MLMHAIRSVDRHLNQHYGPYPIHVLIPKDYDKYPDKNNKADAPYTEDDRALIRSWAPHSQVIFQEVNLYSGDALEPGTTPDQAMEWRKENESQNGHDYGYASMCRLWSGRLQQMEFIREYKYYMRMDDDSILTKRLPFDPFVEMRRKNLMYVWKRESFEEWGIEQLAEVANRHIKMTEDTPFTYDGQYGGEEPYNNFHVSSLSFWNSPRWNAFFNDMDQQHLFFKHRVGDANVHAMTVMMMEPNQFESWRKFPYAHNTNDLGTDYAPKEWKQECEVAAASSPFKKLRRK
jgi:alpha 1,2-mannosyltransferase